MIPYAGVRIFGGRPTKDRVGEYARKAREIHEREGKKFERYADLKVYRLCSGILKLLDAQKKAESRAIALKEKGLDKFALVLWKALVIEERAEKAIAECAEAHITKARALAMIFAIWRTSYEGRENKCASRAEEGGLPKPPREGGAIFQDASCWYNECGSPRFSTVSGRGAVSIFDAERKL
jgi:hypothetical protein